MAAPDQPTPGPERAAPQAAAAERAPERAAPEPAPKRRPDARPTRVLLGLGTFAAMSVVTAGLARFPVATTSDPFAIAPEPTPGAHETVVHRIRYVQLKRGQKPPAGAKVIRGADPTPRVVVRTIPAPRSTATTTRRRPVARSRQSGR
jgi:hypothetical protein